MPVRKRRDRRRRDNKSELAAWKMFFASGYDFFDDLPEIGIQTDAFGVPARDAAREAWDRLGAEFLRTWDDQIPQYGHHAECVFGEPARQKRRVGG